jgi:hypothetical protein
MGEEGMTIKELKTTIDNMPDEAIVYIESDHGQLPEQAGVISKTATSHLEYYGDEIPWDESLAEEKVTAICIS